MPWSQTYLAKISRPPRRTVFDTIYLTIATREMLARKPYDNHKRTTTTTMWLYHPSLAFTSLQPYHYWHPPPPPHHHHLLLALLTTIIISLSCHQVVVLVLSNNNRGGDLYSQNNNNYPRPPWLDNTNVMVEYPCEMIITIHPSPPVWYGIIFSAIIRIRRTTRWWW